LEDFVMSHTKRIVPKTAPRQRRECPKCDGRIVTTLDEKIVKCASDGCGWLGKRYIGGIRMKKEAMQQAAVTVRNCVATFHPLRRPDDERMNLDELKAALAKVEGSTFSAPAIPRVWKPPKKKKHGKSPDKASA
jgi:ribosomal protein L37AE/L43A